jgi:hypothetical protein
MEAYEDMLNKTSKDYAPWFCIPANDKKYMRHAVASIVKEQMSRLPMRYPDVEPAVKVGLEELKAKLQNEPDVDEAPAKKEKKEKGEKKAKADK